MGGPGGRTGWEDRVGGPGGRTGWEDRYEAEGAGDVDRPSGAAEPVAVELPGGEVDGRAGSGAVGRASRQVHRGFGAGFWRGVLANDAAEAGPSVIVQSIAGQSACSARPLDTGDRYPPRQARKPEVIARIASGWRSAPWRNPRVAGCTHSRRCPMPSMLREESTASTGSRSTAVPAAAGPARKRSLGRRGETHEGHGGVAGTAPAGGWSAGAAAPPNVSRQLSRAVPSHRTRRPAGPRNPPGRRGCPRRRPRGCGLRIAPYIMTRWYSYSCMYPHLPQQCLYWT